ncbi:MAG: hypothetical protein ACRD2A_10990, partial [Vicinamibacterales bacterium]
AWSFTMWPVYGQTTRGCQLPPDFPCPEARIMSFVADRASIKPGEAVLLSWVAENPGAMTIAPDVGSVIARGSARLSPSVTTTYTLTVGGGLNGEVLRRTVTVTVAGTTPGAPPAPAAVTPQGVPRMPDGKPSLQGVFNAFGAARGRGSANAPPAPNALPTRPTLKPGMESFRVARDPKEIISDCVVGSVPPSFGPYSFQIIQNPQYVVILYEYMHLFRVVPLDGSPHQPGISWMGDSVGHWDGDTLVIDTVGFNTMSTVGGTGDRHQPYRHSEDLHMVERIRRIDVNTLEIETTLEDPKVFEGPWRTVARYAYHPEFKKVEEYMCAENTKNYDYLK